MVVVVVAAAVAVVVVLAAVNNDDAPHTHLIFEPPERPRPPGPARGGAMAWWGGVYPR